MPKLSRSLEFFFHLLFSPTRMFSPGLFPWLLILRVFVAQPLLFSVLRSMSFFFFLFGTDLIPAFLSERENLDGFTLSLPFWETHLLCCNQQSGHCPPISNHAFFCPRRFHSARVQPFLLLFLPGSFPVISLLSSFFRLVSPYVMLTSSLSKPGAPHPPSSLSSRRRSPLSLCLFE